MLTSERHHYILNELKKHGIVKVQKLTSQLNSSESTIRRDLAELEKQGLLKRVHGGAESIVQKNIELSMKEKTDRNKKEKQAIAQYSAKLIHEHDCIFIDAGTTTLSVIENLPNKEVTIVTNGILHMQEATERGFDTYIIGGKAKSATGAIVGRAALKSLDQYRFDKAFIGTNGIDIQSGFTTPDPEEALIKEYAMKLSQTTYVLADKTKFNKVFFTKMFALNQATIITNALDKDLAAYRKKTNIKEVDK